MPRKAQARMLYASISESMRIAALGVKGALTYILLIAHCDDQGRYAGNAKRVKGVVVPFFDDITEDDIEQALKQMEASRLIIRYTVNQMPLIQIADWWEFNQSLRFINPSRYPPPDKNLEGKPWEDRVKVRPPQAKDGYGRFTRGEES